MSLRVSLDRGIAAAEMAFFAAREKLQTGLVWNPTRADYRTDPYPHYRALRERDPIHRSFAAKGWILSRHRDVVAVLRDPGFSSDERNWSRYRRLRARGARAGLPDPYETERASMLRVDPPDHSRLRNLVSKAFTPRAVEQMRPRIESILKELLDPLGTSGRFELVRDIASPLPVTVIAEMLGVPTEDRERFRHWSDEAIRTLGDTTLEDQRAATQAMQELGRSWRGSRPPWPSGP
jgi:cytochrome P450